MSKAIVTLTDKAKARMEELMRLPDAEGAIGVRLSVPAKGCSGLSYKMEFVTEEKQGDEKIALEGGHNLYIDPMATMFILGTEIDFDNSDPMAPGFKFNNPMATGACGCGESFTTNDMK